jgi:hypothetical protein
MTHVILSAALGMTLAVSSLHAQGTIAGVVLRDSLRTPIDEATVEVPSQKRTVTTDAEGRFRLADLKAGFFDLTVRRVGYRPYTERLRLRDDSVVTLEIPMVRMVVLDSVRVEVARIRSFEEHRALGLGKFLSRLELEKLEQLRLANIISQLAGSSVVNGKGGNAWLVGGRGHIRSIMPGASQQQCTEADPADVVQGAPACACYTQVYLDDMLVFANRRIPRRPEMLFNLNSVLVHQIEAIEYYSSGMQVPIKYSSAGASCGVLVLHTRKAR